MKGPFCLLVILLLSSCAMGQRPAVLDSFTNPDGAFQFVYPDHYELLTGERILRATQGRGAGIPVCDFSTALVCVIYPVEQQASLNFEGAGFSVHEAPGITTESDCLAYAGRLSRPGGEQPPPTSITINGSAFRYVFVKRATAGHSQSSELYISFQKEHCYELRIAISLSDESRRSSSKAVELAEAESARRALKLVLSTFVFR